MRILRLFFFFFVFRKRRCKRQLSNLTTLHTLESNIYPISTPSKERGADFSAIQPGCKMSPVSYHYLSLRPTMSRNESRGRALIGWSPGVALLLFSAHCELIWAIGERCYWMEWFAFRGYRVGLSFVGEVSFYDFCSMYCGLNNVSIILVRCS